MSDDSATDPEGTDTRFESSIRWAGAGMLISLVLIAIKLVGYLITNSAAVLADALESCVHLVTSTFALFAVWLSAQPGDRNHPYGHGKIEYLSAGLEGALVTITGGSVIFLGVKRLVAPVDLPDLGVGAMVELVAAVIAMVGGTLILRAGRRNRSPTIEADGIHIRSDSITSFGGFVGVMIVALTGQVWLDAVVAIVLGVFLLFSGGGVVRRAIGGLMDEAKPELLERIVAMLWDIRRPGWLIPHALKVHRLGQSYHIDVHVVFPRFWDLTFTHAESHRFTEAAQEVWGPRTETMVHAEPCRDSHCHWCDLEDCPIRTEPFESMPVWTPESVSSRTPPFDPTVPFEPATERSDTTSISKSAPTSDSARVDE